MCCVSTVRSLLWNIPAVLAKIYAHACTLAHTHTRARGGGGRCSRASSLLDLYTLDLQLVQVQVLAGLGVESQGLLSLFFLLPLLLLLPASSLYLLLQLVKLAAAGRWRCFKKTGNQTRFTFAARSSSDQRSYRGSPCWQSCTPAAARCYSSIGCSSRIDPKVPSQHAPWRKETPDEQPLKIS